MFYLDFLLLLFPIIGMLSSILEIIFSKNHNASLLSIFMISIGCIYISGRIYSLHNEIILPMVLYIMAGIQFGLIFLFRIDK